MVKLLCKWNLHKWIYNPANLDERTCLRCELNQLKTTEEAQACGYPEWEEMDGGKI